MDTRAIMAILTYLMNSRIEDEKARTTQTVLSTLFALYEAKQGAERIQERDRDRKGEDDEKKKQAHGDGNDGNKRSSSSLSDYSVILKRFEPIILRCLNHGIIDMHFCEMASNELVDAMFDDYLERCVTAALLVLCKVACHEAEWSRSELLSVKNETVRRRLHSSKLLHQALEQLATVLFEVCVLELCLLFCYFAALLLF